MSVRLLSRRRVNATHWYSYEDAMIKGLVKERVYRELTEVESIVIHLVVERPGGMESKNEEA